MTIRTLSQYEILSIIHQTLNINVRLYVRTSGVEGVDEQWVAQ